MSERLRSDQLQIAAINRLEDALDVPGENVIPVAIAEQRDDLDPRVSVGASLDATSPHNAREEVSATVRVIVDGTKDYVASEGTLGLSRIQSDVVDELTASRDGLKATGLNNEDEIAWTEDVNRYLGVSEFGFERADVRTAQHE